ncbi:MAG: hypothetical protein AAFP02_05620 [Bacteroidota bacterium]
MNKLILLLSLGGVYMLSTPFALYGQDASDSPWSLTAGVGGYSRFWSLGTEARLWQGERRELNLRLGFGAQSQRWYVPGRLQYQQGIGGQYLLVNAGATVLRDLSNPINPDFFLLVGAGLGYRYQPEQIRFWFQFGFVLLYETDPTPDQLIVLPGVWRPSFELSFGYRL